MVASQRRTRRQEGPCENYIGNVCSGFGGTLTCQLCHWDQAEHDEMARRIILARIAQDPFYSTQLDQASWANDSSRDPNVRHFHTEA